MTVQRARTQQYEEKPRAALDEERDESVRGDYNDNYDVFEGVDLALMDLTQDDERLVVEDNTPTEEGCAMGEDNKKKK